MSSKIEDFIDLKRLKAGLPTLTFEEFVKKERPELEKRGFSQRVPAYDANGTKGDIWNQWTLFASHELDRVPPHSECDMAMWKTAGRFAYAPMVSAPRDRYTRIFVCSAWYSQGEPHFDEKVNGKLSTIYAVPDWGFKLLKDNFVWHPRFYDMAAPVVKELGLFKYYAVHARYTDFKLQFPAEIRPFEVVADYMAESMKGEKSLSLFGKDMMSRGRMRGEMLAQRFSVLIPRGATLYISTDETDPLFLQAFNDRGINTVTWNQLLEQKDGPLAKLVQELTEHEKYSKWSGPTEQLICAFARGFVGTKLSTFSSYITRMRQYNGAPQQTPLYYNRETSKEDEGKVVREISNWEAEGGISAFKADSISAVLLPQ